VKVSLGSLVTSISYLNEIVCAFVKLTTTTKNNTNTFIILNILIFYVNLVMKHPKIMTKRDCGSLLFIINSYAVTTNIMAHCL
jgi:hypothetical protein